MLLLLLCGGKLQYVVGDNLEPTGTLGGRVWLLVEAKYFWCSLKLSKGGWKLISHQLCLYGVSKSTHWPCIDGELTIPSDSALSWVLYVIRVRSS